MAASWPECRKRSRHGCAKRHTCLLYAGTGTVLWELLRACLRQLPKDSSRDLPSAQDAIRDFSWGESWHVVQKPGRQIPGFCFGVNPPFARSTIGRDQSSLIPSQVVATALRNRSGITSGFGSTHAFGTKLPGTVETSRPCHLAPQVSSLVPKAWHPRNWKSGSYSEVELGIGHGRAGVISGWAHRAWGTAASLRRSPMPGSMKMP